MKQHSLDPHKTETSGRNIGDRLTELANQRWDRGKSLALADSEGIDFNDEHWAVIVFLRESYLEHGLPINLRTPAFATDPSFGTTY